MPLSFKKIAMSVTFTSQDEQFMLRRGSNPLEVRQQFQHLIQGFGFAHLQRAATLHDGIIKLSNSEQETLLTQFDELIGNKQLLKFVPASGAASRMFKEVFGYLSATDNASHQKAVQLLQQLSDYPFYEDLAASMAKDGLDIETEIKKENVQIVLTYLLTDKGLNYGNLPKALLKFHRYPDECRTSLEEHLVEAAQYACGKDGMCHIHFTVSPQHEPLFKKKLQDVQTIYEQRFGVKYDVTFSTQLPATDTLAATEDGQPFRDKNGNLFFRPGGHGTLIHNVNQLRSDVIFVKNIDNVFTDSTLKDTIHYKKLLAAYLLTVQKKVFFYLSLLKKGNVSPSLLDEIRQFLQEKLSIQAGENWRETDFYASLNRPMRVCGMVKNEGEPGGGPFFVTNQCGKTSLQIVESSQIDKKNPQQMAIMQQSTHFNPVDMVCATRDFEGNYFNLLQYVDNNMAFLSSKSYEGTPIKVMELPGLWNGAMADWITIFVEVPLSTFHPVKTMFDLR